MVFGALGATRQRLACDAVLAPEQAGSTALLRSFLYGATEVFSIGAVNSKQMKRWLEQQGATFEPDKGSHLKVFLNGRQSTLPMHGAAEFGKGLEAAIKRQFGLK